MDLWGSKQYVIEAPSVDPYWKDLKKHSVRKNMMFTMITFVFVYVIFHP